MIVGITYDLKEDYLAEGYTEEETAEFDQLDTIVAIENALLNLGFRTKRVGNLRNLTQQLVQGDRWDMIFNIAEGLKGFGREAQVPSLLEAFGIPYTFSDPLTLSITLHKGMTKHIIHDLGIPTPHFKIIKQIQDIDNINLPFPLFVKPISEGTGKGIDMRSKVQNPEELKYVCLKLIEKFHQHVLVETYMPGREFTTGIIGTDKEAQCLGVMEVIFKDSPDGAIYSYYNKANYKELVEYRLVNGKTAQRVKQTALAAWRALGCKDAGRVDLRSDSNDVPNFLELNPLAGLHPEHSDLPILCSISGIKYEKLIGMIMESAIRRLGLKHDIINKHTQFAWQSPYESSHIT